MFDKEKGTIAENRIYWLDNLRTFMIFLVIVLHAAIVYEKYGMGATWWIVCEPSKSDLPGIVFLILDIFVIATIFFISGFFAPLSLKNKNGWEFLKSKFKRLMIPWIIAVLTLIPLYKIIFLYSRGILDYLLSLECALESKLAMVSACSFFIRDILYVPFKSTYKYVTYYFQERNLGGPFDLRYL